MVSYKNINFNYDAQALLDMFNQSNKIALPHRNQADLGKDSSSNPIFDIFFNHFNFIPRNDESMDLSEVTGNSNPHTTPNNNGLIILPVSGVLAFNFYSYVSPQQDAERRPILDPSVLVPEDITEIEGTLYHTQHITSPIMIDGLTSHSYGPVNGSAVAFVLKIPKHITWKDIVEKVN